MFQRHEVDLTCRVERPGVAPVTAHISDVSEGGALLTGASGLTAGTRGTLRMAGFATPVEFTVLGADGAATRVAFTLVDASRVALLSMWPADAPRAAG